MVRLLLLNRVLVVNLLHKLVHSIGGGGGGGGGGLPGTCYICAQHCSPVN